MLFNSLVFLFFFIIVYALYILLRRNLLLQNRMLLVASIVFYGAWSWKFLSLLFLTIVIDYYVALAIDGTDDPRRRKNILAVSIAANLGILGIFKYFNFFSLSFQYLARRFGFDIHPFVLNIVLPVGISFYTFQSMSYTIDVYRRQLKPVRNILDFALFVTYFPQLVAGPIERASHLLPQVIRPRRMSLAQFYEGCYLIFWGLFQKVFVADNLAHIVEPVFASPAPYEGSKVLIALYAFAFQIFCDFAGYSNIARGLGKCMGFDIMINFKQPYFAVNPSDFWKRWHISLSTWLRDYLYIPLGGNKNGSLMTYRNLCLTMLLGGLWHGASWTFVAWGAYHGVLLIGHRLFASVAGQRAVVVKGIWQERIWTGCKIIFFFHLVCLGWLFFRAGSMAQVGHMLSALFTNFNWHSGIGVKGFVSYIWLLVLIEYFAYRMKNADILYYSPVWVRSVCYVVMYVSLLVYGAADGREFIYFQF